MSQTDSRTAGTRSVVSHGLTISYRVHGRGEPLLLLNGLTRPQESWDAFIEAFDARTTGAPRQVVTVDTPGVGGSPASRVPLAMQALAGVAESVLDDLGIARADVLGFSHGGAVAQQLVAQSPHRVRALILAATSCGVGGTTGSQNLARIARAPRTATGARSWPRPDVLGTFWNALALSSWSSIPFLASIAAPTLVVCGERDKVVPPQNSALIARRIPGARLVLLPAGHDLQRRDQAAEFARAVAEFLVELTDRPVTDRR